MDPADAFSALHDLMASNMWAVYACVFVAPFVQEDAGVIGAASLSLGGMGAPAILLLLTVSGLIASDLWKFWVGRFAQNREWARRFAAKPAVERAKELVDKRLGAAIATARFLPGARIALYVAAGYFGASWPRFAFWVAASAALYVGIVFGLFHALGAALGESARTWLPVGAFAALAIALAARAILGRRNA